MLIKGTCTRITRNRIAFAKQSKLSRAKNTVAIPDFKVFLRYFDLDENLSLQAGKSSLTNCCNFEGDTQLAMTAD